MEEDRAPTVILYLIQGSGSGAAEAAPRLPLKPSRSAPTIPCCAKDHRHDPGRKVLAKELKTSGETVSHMTRNPRKFPAFKLAEDSRGRTIRIGLI